MSVRAGRKYFGASWFEPSFQMVIPNIESGHRYGVGIVTIPHSDDPEPVYPTAFSAALLIPEVGVTFRSDTADIYLYSDLTALKPKNYGYLDRQGARRTTWTVTNGYSAMFTYGTLHPGVARMEFVNGIAHDPGHHVDGLLMVWFFHEGMLWDFPA